MKKTIPFKFLPLVFLLTISHSLFAIEVQCSPPKYVRVSSIIPGTISENTRKQHSNIELINVKDTFASILKQTANKSTKNARTTSSAPMSLSAIEIDAISSPRSSWLTLLDNAGIVSMDIGVADLNNAQTWTLPSNFLDEFESYYNEDFIPVSEVPDDLKFEDANKVVKSEYEDSEENTIEVYEHYIIDADEVLYIGISYYYYLDGDEDAFDATDYKFSDVPVQLNDSYTYQVQEDEAALRNLRYIESTKTIDAFGTLNTPYGTFDCLRMTFNTYQYTRPNISSPYENDRTSQSVGFLTDQGHFFLASYASALSGTVTLSDITFRVVAPTGILQDQSEVQINNDANGVLISNTGVYIDVLTKTADKDAILDIESDDKGIMIPRLEMANRPASPNEGLLIYQLDNTPGFYYYDGYEWTRLDNTTSTPAARIAAPLQTATAQPNAKVYKKGFGTLKNGSTFIPMKATNGMSPEEMLIQLQPEGQCNGLYISKKTAEGFEVKELNNGKSNIKFSWTLN